MNIKPVTIATPRWSFNISRAECAQLGRLNRTSSSRQLRQALAPIAARVFGLTPENLMNKPSVSKWVKRIIESRTHPVDAARALLDLENPLTQVLLEYEGPCTSFFRDREQYDLFCRVFDELFREKDPDKPVRIWVPACCRGQEAYTIAMILHAKGYKAEILGTDIVEPFIRAARSGRYYQLDERPHPDSNPETRELLSGPYRKYFIDDPKELHYQVRPEIMAMVKFELDNIIYSKVEGPFDVISCHFVLMHLERAPSRRARKYMLGSLREGGYIVSSENYFRGIDPKILQPLTSKTAAYAAYRSTAGR